jgi:cytochrome c oxidase subunit 1
MKTKGFLSVFVFLLAVCLLPHLLIWIHHRLVFGLNPFVGQIFMIVIFLVSIPFVIKWFRWLSRQKFVKSNKEPIVLFAMGVMCLIISFIILGNSSMNIQIHDTYFIISNFSIVLFSSFLFGIFFSIYYLFPRIFKRDLNVYLSRFHFWITYIGVTLLFSVKYPVQIINEPRRYIEYSGWTSYQDFEYFNRYIVIAVMLVLVAQLLFIFNIIYSLFKESRSGSSTI